jgi:hypothetical protein
MTLFLLIALATIMLAALVLVIVLALFGNERDD